MPRSIQFLLVGVVLGGGIAAVIVLALDLGGTRPDVRLDDLRRQVASLERDNERLEGELARTREEDSRIRTSNLSDTFEDLQEEPPPVEEIPPIEEEAEPIEDAAHLEVLQIGLQAWDRAARCRERIDADGEVMLDRFGQQKPHVLLPAERDARSQFLTAVRSLGLDPSGVV